MTDEQRASTEQTDVERTEEGAKNAGERTVQEQKEGGFTHGDQEGPYGGGTEAPGHEGVDEAQTRSDT